MQFDNTRNISIQANEDWPTGMRIIERKPNDFKLRPALFERGDACLSF
jgi:hypothetical protein